jgi:hypothetical protein
MFETVKLPAGISDLDPGLSDMNANNFPHLLSAETLIRAMLCDRRRRRKTEIEEMKAVRVTHRLSLSRLSKIAVMVKSLVYLIIRDSQAHKFSKYFFGF